MKRMLSMILSLLLILALPVQAMAATYYLEDGSVTVTAEKDKPQTVKQGDRTIEDDAPIISQKDSETVTVNTITLESTNGATVEVIIKNVNIVAPSGNSQKDTSVKAPITVTPGSSAEITVQGTNAVQGQDSFGSDYFAGVEVSSTASLTITEESTGSLETTGGTASAGIGGSFMWNNERSRESAGTITINGGEITAIGGTQGAGIGGAYSGNGGNITIGAGATVIAQAGSASSSGTQAIGHGDDTENATTSFTVAEGAGVIVCNDGETPTPTGGGTITTISENWEYAQEHVDEILAEPSKPTEPEPTPEPKEDTPDIWEISLERVYAAQEGSTLTIDLSGYNFILNTLIEAAQKRNITLIIQWDGGADITIAPTDKIDLTVWHILLADLEK